VKLLLDQNLPKALLSILLPHFPMSAHVADLELTRATDEALWTRARAIGFEIATRDSDFLDIAELRGPPPKILLLRLGNVSVAGLLAIVQPLVATLPSLLQESSLGVAIEGAPAEARRF
jgi:predicted nuclease of predicted toxin-antitoxin system